MSWPRWRAPRLFTAPTSVCRFRTTASMISSTLPSSCQHLTKQYRLSYIRSLYFPLKATTAAVDGSHEMYRILFTLQFKLGRFRTGCILSENLLIHFLNSIYPLLRQKCKDVGKISSQRFVLPAEEWNNFFKCLDYLFITFVLSPWVGENSVITTKKECHQC